MVNSQEEMGTVSSPKGLKRSLRSSAPISESDSSGEDMKYIPVPLSKKEAMRKKKKLAIAKTGSHKGRGKKVAKLANPLLNIDDFDSADMTTAVAEIQTGELPAAFHLASRELKTLITCICLTYNVETKSREEISSKLGNYRQETMFSSQSTNDLVVWKIKEIRPYPPFLHHPQSRSHTVTRASQMQRIHLPLQIKKQPSPRSRQNRPAQQCLCFPMKHQNNHRLSKPNRQ